MGPIWTGSIETDPSPIDGTTNVLDGTPGAWYLPASLLEHVALESIMKLGKRLLVLLGLVALTACGQAELVVTAEMNQPGDDGSQQMRPLADLEIQVLPYDRDAVFDSMTTAYATPEPPIPDSVLQAQEQVRTAQEEWRSAETRWQAGRDRLQAITTEMDGLTRGETRYAVLFREFGDVEAEVARLERTMNSAFEEFDSLQKASLNAIEQACIMQANWADDVFAEVGEAISQRITATGRGIQVDTTDAQGIATCRRAIRFRFA